MPREESPYPADWLRIAEKDLGRAGLTEDDVRSSLMQVEALIKKLRAEISGE